MIQNRVHDQGQVPHRERGVALVAVLWILALLATLVLGFVADTQPELRIARNNVEAARAGAIADAGVTMAILGVFNTAPTSPWRGDGRVLTLAYGGGTIRVHIEDEDGKLDVNKTPIPRLRALFAILGAEDPDLIANSIAEERRSAIDNALLSGDLGAVAPPAFFAMDELGGLPGVTPALYRRLRRVLTVYSGNAVVDSRTAPAEVLKSMPGAEAAQVDATIALREQAATAAARGESAADELLEPKKELHTFTIVSEATMASGARATHSATVSLTGVPEAPVQFMAWRDGRSDDGIPPAAPLN